MGQPPAPPPPGLPRRAAGYALFAAASVGALAAGQRLDRADLRAPFAYSGDALLILPLVKAAVETGTHWHTARLGAPGGQDLHDFPVVDHLHLALIWALGRAVPDPAAVFNLYHLLTYPLTVLTAMAVLRHFGLSVPAAGCGGLLYAFQPYHHLRGLGHYFLAAYWVVPLALMVALWVCRGRLPFFRPVGGRHRFTLATQDTWVAVLVGLATASAGAYYAFFGCALVAAAGGIGWVATTTWRAAGSAALVVAVTVAAGVLNHAPAFAYQAEFGPNSAPHERRSEEAEEYGLKLTHLLLPVAGHRVPALAAARAAYDSPDRPVQTENKDATLGLVGAAGLVVLLGVAVLPVNRGWPIGPVAGLAAFAVLLGTVGGLGAVFNHLVSPQVRALNRVSIYLAFLALFAALWPVDRWLAGRAGWARWIAFLGLAAVGLADQLDRRWFTDAFPRQRAEAAARWRADAEFFARVEAGMPGGAVFMLPFVPYPETLAVGRLAGYDHARGYLHTRTVRWSFGAMKGREVDQWQREVAGRPTPELLRRAVARGFTGLFVDRRGYPAPAAADKLLAEVRAELGPDAAEWAHPDGDQVAVDLRPLRARLERADGPGFADLCRREAEAVRVLWLSGFVSFEPPGDEWKHRWCGRAGTAVLVNPSDRPRTVRLGMLLRADADEPADLKIEGDVWADRFPVTRQSPSRTWTAVVPPGRHPVRFRCRPPAGHLPKESRRLAFFVAEFRLTRGGRVIPRDPRKFVADPGAASR